MGNSIGTIIHYINLFVKKAEDEVTNVGGAVKPIQAINFELPEGIDQYSKDIFSKQFNVETLKSLSDVNKIKYYIQSLLKTGDFDLGVLRQLDARTAMYYIEHLLRPVTGGKDAGMGSGRLVYDLGDRVLKMAHNQSGLYQNTMESRIANRNDKFASVFDVGPGNQWIISEKVVPFEPGEFSVVTGIPENITQSGNASALASLKDSELQRLITRYDLEPDSIQFLKEMSKMIRDFGVIAGDIMNPAHWGRSTDGKIKLYDYGLDSYGHDKFYDKSTSLTKEGPSEEDQRLLWEFMQKSRPSEEHKELGVVEVANVFYDLVKNSQRIS